MALAFAGLIRPCAYESKAVSSKAASRTGGRREGKEIVGTGPESHDMMFSMSEGGAGDEVQREALVGLVRSGVDEFDAITPREIASRSRILLELDRLDDPFDRDLDPVHITGSAIVVGSRGVVLHRHKRIGVWMQPGGHLERGETPWEAARRETKEETGLPVRHPAEGKRLVHLDAHPAGTHFHLDLRYLLFTEDLEPSPPPDESQHVQWFSLDEALELADEALVDGLNRLVERGSA